LNKSIIKYFNLNIYILSLFIINKATLTSLFAKLLSRCVILLKDINAVSSNQDVKTKDSRQIMAPFQEHKPAFKKVSLSTLLNVIDSIAS
jgi:hypothetical protein